MKQLLAATQTPGGNSGNVSSLAASFSVPSSPSPVHQPVLPLESDRSELPPPPPPPVMAQGQALNEQQIGTTAEEFARLSRQERPQPLAAVTRPAGSEPQPVFSSSGPIINADQPKPDVVLAHALAPGSAAEVRTQALTLQEFLKLSSLSSAGDQDNSAQARLQQGVTRLSLNQYRWYWQSVIDRNAQTTQSIPTFGFIDFEHNVVVLPESALLGAAGH